MSDQAEASNPPLRLGQWHLTWAAALGTLLVGCTSSGQQPPSSADLKLWRGVQIAAAASGPDATLYVAGTFEGTARFETIAGASERTSAGFRDAFVARLRNDGTAAWVQTFGGSQQDEARALTVLANGTVVVAGFFGGRVDFDPGEAVAEAFKTGSAAAAFVVGFGADSGAHRFVTSFETDVEPDASYGESLASLGDRAVVAGRFRGNLRFTAGVRSAGGGMDAFIATIAADGTVEATSVVASAGDDAAVVAAATDELWVAARHGAAPFIEGLQRDRPAGITLWSRAAPAELRAIASSPPGAEGESVLAPHALVVGRGEASDSRDGASILVGGVAQGEALAWADGTTGWLRHESGFAVRLGPGGAVARVRLFPGTAQQGAGVEALAFAPERAFEIDAPVVVAGRGLGARGENFLQVWSAAGGLAAPWPAAPGRRGRALVAVGRDLVVAGDAAAGEGSPRAFLARLSGL